MHRARAPPPLRLSHPILCQKSSPRCRPWVLLVPVIFPVQLSHPRPPPAHAHSSHRRPVGPLGIRGPLLSPGPVGILCSGLRRQAAPWLRLHTVLWLPWWGWGAAAGGVGGTRQRGPRQGSHTLMVPSVCSLAAFLYCFPAISLLGLFPQIDTFCIYLLEQIDMLFFGGSGKSRFLLFSPRKGA